MYIICSNAAKNLERMKIMKKRLSLILAAIFVVVTLVSALPFGAFAALPEDAEVRIGDKFFDFETALIIANGSDVDVTLTLLKDITHDAVIPLYNQMKKADGSDVHVTIDGNGHTLSGNAGNWLQPGGGGGADKTATITIKDLNINYSGVGSVIHIYSGGNYTFENVNIDCVKPVDWSAINMNNMGNGPDNVMNIDMYNVNIKTLAYGNSDPSVFRVGNPDGATNSPFSDIYLENCTFAAVGELAEGQKAAIGLHFTSPNCRMEGVNTKFISQNDSALYVGSDASTKIYGDPVDGVTPIKLGKFTDCTFETLGVERLAPEHDVLYRGEWMTWETTGNYPATEGKQAVVFDDTGAGTAYDTLAAAVDAANAAISDTKIVLCSDVDLGSTVITLKNAAKKAIVFDGNNYTITATAGNAIKVGADGDTDAKVSFKNLNIDYTGVGSIIQIYAGGEVDLYNVKIQSGGKLNWCAVNALNKAGTELKLDIVDCVITGIDDGNNANVGLVRTGNGANIVYLNIVDSTIMAQAGAVAAAKPIVALNITTALATVTIDNCLLSATTNSAIIAHADLAAKVEISNSYIENNTEDAEVLSDAAKFTFDPVNVTIEGGPKENTGDTTPEETTPNGPTGDTTPTETTPNDPAGDTTPDQGGEGDQTTPNQGGEGDQTTAKPDEPKGGACGGIAIAAQLAALICAAAAVMIIKKK